MTNTIIITNQIEYDNAQARLLTIQNEIESLVDAGFEVPESLYEEYAQLDIACMNY